MRTPSWLHDPGMSTAKTSRVRVEFEMGADPIRGSIERSDGRSQRFWGWLELIEKLERAAADEPKRNAEPTPGKPPRWRSRETQITTPAKESS